MKLEISLFRFDKNSDYLPYYTKHFIKVENEENLLDILNTINKKENFAYENTKDFDLVLNNIFVKANISIEDITSHFGKELVIEPLSIKRASNDLLINDEDFYKKLEILKDFINEEDKKFYENLKHYYYASNTLNYYEEYIGDALIILANRIIEKNPSLEKKILNILKKQDFSLSFHTSLEKRIFNFDKSIEDIIKKMQDKFDLKDISFKTKDLSFGNFEENIQIKYNLEGFNMSYYLSKKEKKYMNFLQSLKAKNLKLNSLNFDLGRKNKNLTLSIAKDILLDCFDNNVDFLILDNEEDFFIFDKNQKSLEKLSKREINLSILHINEVQMLCVGKHKELKTLFKQHSIKPKII